MLNKTFYRATGLAMLSLLTTAGTCTDSGGRDRIPVIGLQQGSADQRCPVGMTAMFVSGTEAASCVDSQLARYLTCVSVVSSSGFDAEFEHSREAGLSAGGERITIEGNGGSSSGGVYSTSFSESDPIARARAVLLLGCARHLTAVGSERLDIPSLVTEAERLYHPPGGGADAGVPADASVDAGADAAARSGH